MAGKKKKSLGDNTIAMNRRALHDYHLVEKFEAGLSLEGWEVKSLRDGRGQLVDGYVVVKDHEAFLIGVHITPLLSASTHIVPDPDRRRKLLLHRKEINHLISSIEIKGMTAVPIRLYWKNSRVKCEVALAKGKKQHDKREADKKRDWVREQARHLKG